MEDLSRLDGETEMEVQFHRHVLTISLCGRFYDVDAFGDSWPHPYRVIVTPDSKLPPRFKRSWVEVSAFEGHMWWERVRVGP